LLKRKLSVSLCVFRAYFGRSIHGFRLSILFTIIVTSGASVISIITESAVRYFGGWSTAVFQRLLIGLNPALRDHYSVRDFGAKFLAAGLPDHPVQPALVGVVRAEFLRARNFEQSARSAGRQRPRNHVPPHAPQRDGRD
jgi:microcin C transport system permease protein